ncbi:efflux RND transporter periplasmic adaptor subunit [Robiginitalea marina]|uniref:Efflux RND transporter periplasmic adaptor subunit n=1 Tax=Robiginitalea marina TaxID=2954105 RepID=A0ABT1AW66_9FLAO|nr:efflux RND transporter periplasmic adaptor subunit [Robiginitalea marina]MCO5723944.1 efflux RND transporter periplasmic adaptor subunit [Robiginitalea marina]
MDPLRLSGYAGFPALVFLLFACKGEPETVRPEIRDITASVYASATVQPDSMYQVHAAVSGILERNAVQEGDLVAPGTLLMHITDRTPRLSSENARLQMELATENYQGPHSPLRDLETRIRTATLTFRDDSLNYRRQEKLWSENIGSRATLENRKLAYERSRNQLEGLKSEYMRLEDQLRTLMIQARNTFRSSVVNTEDYAVRSTIHGRVYALEKEPGELVVPGEPLALLGSPDTFVVELLVDEVDVVALEVGQTALVLLDAYPETLFETRVSKIYPRKDERNQTFTVESRFDAPPAILYPGMSGEANIIIGRKEGVLTIPRAYLAGKDSVRTREGYRAVITGLQTLDRVEILSGLEAGTELLKPEE